MVLNTVYHYYYLSQLRQKVAERLDSLVQASSYPGSTQSVLIVPALTSVSGDSTYWSGAWVLITNGANMGFVAKVKDYNPSTSALSIDPMLPNEPDMFAALEIYTMVDPRMIQAAINQALGRIPRRVSATWYQTDARDILGANELPAGCSNLRQLVGLWQVEPRDPDNPFIDPVPKTMTPLPYRILDSADGQFIEADFQPGYYLAQYMDNYPALAFDEEKTDCPLELLMPAALAAIYRMLAARAPAQDAKRWEARAKQFEDEFQAAAYQVMPRPRVRVQPPRLTSAR